VTDRRGRIIDRLGAIQPIWLTAHVPPDASPGEYRGTLTISAEAQKLLTVPVALRVARFVLPSSKGFVTFVGVIQSPDSVALRYGVPMWSERHWNLMERSLRLLGQAGVKTIYIPVIRRTHFGNEHGMVHWVTGPDGTRRPDFSIAERYLDLAVKHLGKAPVVGLYVWEPPSSMGHYGTYKPKDRDILYTARDASTGKLSDAVGPAWGTDECKQFWKPLVVGMKRVLAKRGLGESMMFAMAGDYKPTGTAVDTLKAVAPQVKWISHQHSYSTEIQGQPSGYIASVWGLSSEPRDPEVSRLYGWRNPVWAVRCPRNDVRLSSKLAVYRIYPEGWLSARGRYGKSTPGGRRGGIGRIGADFWDLPNAKGDRGYQNLIGRYPDTAWGQLTLNFCIPRLLAPGREGAVSTVRFEMLRENIQECEARAVLDDAVGIPKVAAKIDPALRDRCLKMLDERVRLYLRVRTAGGWRWLAAARPQEMTERFYNLAHEVRMATKP